MHYGSVSYLQEGVKRSRFSLLLGMSKEATPTLTVLLYRYSRMTRQQQLATRGYINILKRLYPRLFFDKDHLQVSPLHSVNTIAQIVHIVSYSFVLVYMLIQTKSCRPCQYGPGNLLVSGFYRHYGPTVNYREEFPQKKY